MTTFNVEKAKFWSDTQRTPDFQKYRKGGAALNGIDVDKTKELMMKLGLPWDEIPPHTVDRMTWMMPMLADYPVEILKYVFTK